MDSTKEGLTRAELRTWKGFLSGVSALFDALDRDLRDTAGMSLDDFGLLRPLWASPNSALSMSELGDQLAFSPSRLSHAVQRMEANGWVTKERSTEDKRVKLVRLTPKGRNVFREAWPRHAQLVRELFLDQLEQREAIIHAFTMVRRAARNSGRRT